MAYSAFVLTEKTRNMLLERFSPRFPDVIAHHVTWEFGIDPLTAALPDPTKKLVLWGYCRDESLECFIVEYDGWGSRPDGKPLHLTYSLDRTAGRKPVDSNDVIKSNPTEFLGVNLLLEYELKILK